MVEELLAARGITVSYEAVRQWALKFGQAFANRMQRGDAASATNGTSTRSR
jgi:putative transposase